MKFGKTIKIFLIDGDPNGRMSVNFPTAAAIVMGRNANGLTEWKTKDGRTLKEFESEDKNSKA